MLGLHWGNRKENGNYYSGGYIRAKKPPPLKGLNIRIPIIIPVQWRGFIHNQGSGLPQTRISPLNPNSKPQDLKSKA